jgi:hypothetical protein
MTQDLAHDAVTGDKIEDSAVELSVETRAGPPTAIEPGGSGQGVAECDEGEVVVGGRFENDIGFQLNTSEPDGNLWVVEERETQGIQS